MNCPKHVEFYSKNEFEKLAHLVGFINKKRKSVECRRSEDSLDIMRVCHEGQGGGGRIEAV